MLNFDQFLSDDNTPVEPRPITLLNTYREPADVYLIKSPIGEAKIHFDSDPQIKGPFKCPGANCPKCRLGAEAAEHLLFPIYATDHQTVKVLMIPKSNRPSDLLPQLKAAWREDPNIEHKLATITQNGYRYRLDLASKTTDPTSPSTLIRQKVVSQFLRAFEVDPQLIYSAVRQPTVEELREIPSIRNRLVERGELADDDFDLPFSVVKK